MTRDVLVTISGIQTFDGDGDDVEIITKGDYFQKNGKHYVVYDETMEGVEGIVKNTIKIHPNCLEVIKRGSANVHMVFETNKKNLSCYNTPYGDMIVGIHTGRITIEEAEDRLAAEVDYTLDINYQHVSDCKIKVDIQSRETAQIRLS